jgi:hypothetical protein
MPSGPAPRPPVPTFRWSPALPAAEDPATALPGLRRATVAGVIADVTGKNPNVNYELGISRDGYYHS